MDFTKLKKEDLVERLTALTENPESLEAKLNEALTKNTEYEALIGELQEANKELAEKKPSDGVELKIAGKKYLLMAPFVRYSKYGKVSAEDLQENPGGKYDEFLERLVKKGSGLLKKVD